MEKYLVLIFSSLLAGISLAQDQDSKKEYIITRDSILYKQGMIRLDPADIQKIEFRMYTKDKYKTYSSADLVEFGLSDGTTFFSELVGDNYVNMEQVIEGNTSLLTYKTDEESFFFLRLDSVVQEITQVNYRSIGSKNLRNQLDLENVASITRFNLKSLSRLISYGNSETTFFPTLKYGVNLGMSSRAFTLLHDGENVTFAGRGSMILGGYLDLPIGVYSRMSLRVEALYGSTNYSVFSEKSNSKRDYLVKLQTMSLPLLLRYRMKSTSNTRPFANAGMIYTQNGDRFDNILITVSNDPTVIRTFDLESSRKDFGWVLGAGIEYSHSFERTIGLEVRYHSTQSLNEVEMPSKTFQVISSINF